MGKTKITIHPVNSQISRFFLIFCSIGGIAIFTVTLVISILINKYNLMVLFSIISAAFLILGIILYMTLQRAKIVFDSKTQMAILTSNKFPQQIIPFSELQTFQIYELLRGYAHQFYCRNGSFGNYSDLFLSAHHSKAFKKAKRLINLTGGSIVDCDGTLINPS